jgi:hypothetical protein
MIVRLFLLFVPALLLADEARPDSAARLSVHATPAIVQVKPLAEGRKLIRLPTLEFRFTIQAVCAINTEAKSISISIADTRKTISGDDIATVSDMPIVFSVPARQVSPVAVDGFCPLADDRDRLAELLVRSAVTVHLSLRCSGEKGQAITYASHALDVMLQCPGRGDDQGESVSEIAR